MRMIASGDRDWTDVRYVCSTLNTLWEQYGLPFTLIEGQARGLDKIAGEWAEQMRPQGVEHIPMPARWRRTTAAGKEYFFAGAGPERNREMLIRLLEGDPDEVRLVVAFHDALTQSKGTANMVQQAEEAVRQGADLGVLLVRHEGSYD